jgi:hypothetical protein
MLGCCFHDSSMRERLWKLTQAGMSAIYRICMTCFLFFHRPNVRLEMVGSLCYYNRPPVPVTTEGSVPGACVSSLFELNDGFDLLSLVGAGR